MTIENVELRLIRTDAPAGQISLAALAALAPLAGALQLLATRIARDLAGETGPGRSTTAVEQVARLRLGEVRDGSTRLMLSAGDDTHDVDSPLETSALDRLWEVLEGLSSGKRPSWVTENVGDAALQLTSALDGASRRAEFTGRRGAQVRPHVVIRSRQVDRAVWHLGTEPERITAVRASGLLDLVDLRRRRFRIRDDVGNDIDLDDVANAPEAAGLVGDRVTAEGDAQLGARGRITRLDGLTVARATLPTAWTASGRVRAEEEAARSYAVPGPDTHGVEGVNDDDVEAFLASLRA